MAELCTTSCFEVSLVAPGIENEPLPEKTCPSRLALLKISIVDLSYACTDLEGG